MSIERETPGAIIVFDGVCVLCNGWVRFLLRHDRREHYRFAAMQTPAGRKLLEVHGLVPDDPVSFLVLEGDGVGKGRAWTDTDAIARVLAGLGGPWRAARAIAWCPRALRDRLYRWGARNRYRWFGRHAHCLLATTGHASRFLP